MNNNKTNPWNRVLRCLVAAASVVLVGRLIESMIMPNPSNLEVLTGIGCTLIYTIGAVSYIAWQLAKDLNE